MVSSTTRKIFSLAISLLVVVISLTGIALGATVPSVANTTPSPTRYTPGFSGAPGKMARDTAQNFYVADFWGKGIRKFARNGANPTLLATSGRPTAVAVLPDNRLVVAMQSPQAKIVFYSQQTGLETPFTNIGYQAPVRPSGIAVDQQGYIYVVDAGDNSNDTAASYGRVMVYSQAGACVKDFGGRIKPEENWSTLSGVRFKQPQGIAYEKVSNRIVVVDTLSDRIQFFKTYTEDPTFSANDATRTFAGVAQDRGSFVTLPAVGSATKFWNPVDIAFEYDASGTVLYRMYVAERGRNEIAVVNADTVTAPYTTYGVYLRSINSSTAALKLPSAVIFEKTATGGVLYTNNAPSATAADVLALAIDGGSIPAPTVTLTMEAVAPTTVGTNLPLSGTVSPLRPVTCNVNGSGIDFAMSSSTSWNGSVTLVPNTENYILCKSSDVSGVTTYVEARTYSTPSLTAAPSLTITSPAGTVYTKDATVLVSGSTAAGATVKIDNPGKPSVTPPVDGAGNWSASVDLVANSSNVLSVTAWTPGSNTASQARTVIADNTPPTGTISFLANDLTTVNAVQNLDGIITDANLDSIEVNGVAVPSSAKVVSGANTYFSVPVTLGRGLNTVTVKATDLLGYTSDIATRTVTLNPDLPGFTVELPADNSYRTAAGSIAANGLAAASYTLVTAGNTTATPSGGTWLTGTNMTVSTGFNSYQFTASGSGPSVSEKRTINASGTQLAITSPPADFATKNSSVPIAGNVASCSPMPTISADGGTAVNVTTCNAGNFSHTLTLSSQGTHVVKVTANATSAIRNIIYDTAPPEMSIQADAHTTPSTVAGVIEPSAKISVIEASLNSIPLSIPLSVITYTPAAGQVVWNADLSAYSYDEGSLAFTAIDPALNTNKLFYVKGVPTGDCNGDGIVNMNDALLSLRHVAGTTTLTGVPRFQCDVGGLVGGHAAQDGEIDITDAVLILGKSAGIVSF